MNLTYPDLTKEILFKKRVISLFLLHVPVEGLRIHYLPSEST